MRCRPIVRKNKDLACNCRVECKQDRLSVVSRKRHSRRRSGEWVRKELRITEEGQSPQQQAGMASHAAEHLHNEWGDSVTATESVMVLCPKTVRRMSKDGLQQPRLRVAKSDLEPAAGTGACPVAMGEATFNSKSSW
eukprot:5191998-Pleurochrysis_carterae.AAC.2